MALGQTRFPPREEGLSPLYLEALRPSSSNTKVWLVWPPPSVPPWTPPGLHAPSASGMRAGGGSDPEPREKGVGRDRRLLLSPGPEIHFSLSDSKGKKNVAGSWFGRRPVRAPCRPRREPQGLRAELGGRGPSASSPWIRLH